MFITIQYSKTKFLIFWSDAQNVKKNKQKNINTGSEIVFLQEIKQKQQSWTDK